MKILIKVHGYISKTNNQQSVSTGKKRNLLDKIEDYVLQIQDLTDQLAEKKEEAYNLTVIILFSYYYYIVSNKKLE